jgi:carboxymethylenebutenolidase
MTLSSTRLRFRLLVVITVLAFRMQAAFAATQPAPVSVSYKSGDDTVVSQLYQPAGKGAHPAIVLVHEWWGVTPWVLTQAQTYADHGYAALVIDLYRGASTQDPMVAHELMRGVPQDRALRDMKAAVAYLQTRKDVLSEGIGAVGWCMGGGYALQLAVADSAVKAVAVNYGALVTDKPALAAMRAAVLGNFGGLDRGIPPDSVKAFEATLKADGKSPDIKIYPDAGHAFENPGNKDGYRQSDAADAQNRMLAFFHTQLQQ